MFEFEGAPLKDAFSILGDGSKKSKKEKNKENPRDEEPNKLNHINFEENMKFVVERYDKVINNLISEIKKISTDLKFVSMSRTSNNTTINLDVKPNKFQNLTTLSEKIKNKFKNSKVIMAYNDDLSL